MRSNRMTRTDAPQRGCPCGSNKEYAECCEPLHKGEPAPNAEALMRSRYTAFFLGLTDYIERSWHSSTRPKQVEPPNDAEKPQWIGLQVKRHDVIDDDRGVVEFIARYKLNDRAYAIHEISRFVRENGHWFYLDGKFPRRR
jgi:SEC-C motif domain protein